MTAPRTRLGKQALADLRSYSETLAGQIDMRTLIEVLRKGGYHEAAGEISDNADVIAQLYAQAMAAKAKED